MVALLAMLLAAFVSNCGRLPLQDSGVALEAAVPHLVEALRNENVAIRERAIRSLAALGPYARSSVPALIESMKDERLKWKAMEALGDIGPDAALAVPALAGVLGERHTTHYAREALVKIGPNKTSIELLAEIVKQGNADARCEAASILGQFGADAKAAVGNLCAALDAEDRVASAAMYSLGGIGRPAVPALIAILESNADRSVRWRAIFAFTVMGANAADAVPSLQNATNDEDENIRSAAESAIGRIRLQLDKSR